MDLLSYICIDGIFLRAFSIVKLMYMVTSINGGVDVF
jgi:hypothetical protein